jgi:predicted RNA binding protein YcfA (HicA-like mRNA interferase family)
MKNYNETIKEMESNGWFRISESNTHIFFVKRTSDGYFIRTAIEYAK